MIGTRLAVIIEAAALFCFGFIISCFYSWQLALLVYVLMLFYFIVTATYIRLQTRADQCTDIIVTKTCSVNQRHATCFSPNMI